MPARDDEGDRGQRDLAVGEEGGRDVARHVVHGHERLAVHERDRLGRLQAHEQRAHEARPLGHRDRGEVLEAASPASAIAGSTTGTIVSRWWREASSGTTPP